MSFVRAGSLISRMLDDDEQPAQAAEDGQPEHEKERRHERPS
jgi:hypothetical protein